VKQIEKGNAFLFAGAGFSIGATNSLKKDPPTGDQLAELLAEECCWPYNHEDLPSVYSAAESHLGQAGMRKFLERHYLNCSPGWQRLVSEIPWYRIYTTNIDDVLENAYGGSSFQRIISLTYPIEYSEADPVYGKVQCMHLHGWISDPNKKLTFTLEDFAGHTTSVNPWYTALVDDMQGKSGVFVGTRLNEVPFYHYLTLRAPSPTGSSVRAKAYIIAPNIGPILRRTFQQRNIEVIEATAEDFFTALTPLIKEKIPNQLALLANVRPDLIESLQKGFADLNSAFLQQFELVSAIPAPKKEKTVSVFFDGAEPTWKDIYNEWDAQRKCIDDFVTKLEQKPGGIRTVVLIGHAGSGKSTALKRAAVELAKKGETVYFSRDLEKLDRRSMARTLSLAGSRQMYLVFDNAISYLDQVDEISADIPQEANVTFVFAERSHVIFPRFASLKALKPEVAELTDLNKEDCNAVIDKLSLAGRLGKLNGQPRPYQINEFMIRAKKQLLVALKEATLSDGYNRILANEYNELKSDKAKLVYLISCLAYMHGTPVKHRQLLACIDGTDLEKNAVLEYNLKHIVVPWRERKDLLCPRHAVIAREIALHVADEDMKREGIITFLMQISSEITPLKITARVPEYLAYRGIVNFDNLRELFGEEREKIIEIYDALKAYYSDDFLFWLQMGRCEVYFDYFDNAENYIDQSLALRPYNNFQAIHQKGTLLLKRSIYRESRTAAIEDARRGEEILIQQIRDRGGEDAYPYTALFTHKVMFLRTHPLDTKLNELKTLVELSREAARRHPFDEQLKAACDLVMREYLMQAVGSE
jgi:hypothetical protein